MSAQGFCTAGDTITVWDCFPGIPARRTCKHDAGSGGRTGNPHQACRGIRAAETAERSFTHVGLMKKYPVCHASLSTAFLEQDLNIPGLCLRSCGQLPCVLSRANICGARVIAIDIPRGSMPIPAKPTRGLLQRTVPRRLSCRRREILSVKDANLRSDTWVFPIGLPIDFADRALQ